MGHRDGRGLGRGGGGRGPAGGRVGAAAVAHRGVRGVGAEARVAAPLHHWKDRQAPPGTWDFGVVVGICQDVSEFVRGCWALNTGGGDPELEGMECSAQCHLSMSEILACHEFPVWSVVWGSTMLLELVLRNAYHPH